ncbi:MAG: tripartite tricarboxylate transporter substrate binding protein [Pseudolabrys sp.]|jgi:tripartite-type tricarboxylate transporter receptor subunit TctC|nr:tripartite tricarboxylate transporter substrate binding protein [Pseudolabrys sp.]MCW5686095.1 tripartite tricarboxylate transporter substrate binding protein [Pseudolabrys sp.]
MTKRFSRRTFAKSLASVSMLMAGSTVGQFSPAMAQAKYPSRPVTIVVPFGAGGVGDLTARLAAMRLSEKLGQQFVIENKPGAGGIVAARAVTGAAPDGYTLGLVANGTAVSVAMFKSLPIDPVKQFEMISLMGTFDLVIVASADSQYQSLRDFIAAAKAKPGALNVGTISIGSGQHLAAELLKMTAGVDVQIVPHKTSGDVITSLLRNDVQIGVEIPAAVNSVLADHKVRGLATTGLKRSQVKELAGIPTVQEQGIAGFEVVSWNGFFAPVGTPKDIIATINTALHEIMAEPDIQKRYLDLGVLAEASSPADLKDKLISDIKKWSDVIQRAGIERR